MRTVQCSGCDTYNDRTTAMCTVCSLPLPVSRVRGTRISRVRKNLGQRQPPRR
jgi:hypothetical protein